jgi:hypothetical protein
MDLDQRSRFQVPGEKRRHDALDGLGGGGDAENADAPPAHRLGVLAELGGRGQEIAAARQEPLAVTRQLDPTSRAVEEPDAELRREVVHLPRQRGLRDAEPGRRARERPRLGDGQEVAEMTELHRTMPWRHGL